MNPMLQRAIVAAVYGLGAAIPVFVAAFEDAVISGSEWGGVFAAFIVAFWGTFKSNTTIISPNRKVWTPAERLIETAKMDASVKVQNAEADAAAMVEKAKTVAERKP